MGISKLYFFFINQSLPLDDPSNIFLTILFTCSFSFHPPGFYWTGDFLSTALAAEYGEVDSALHTVQCKLHTEYCTLYNAHCALNTAHCKVHTAHWILHTAHCTLQTAHSTQHTAHWILHTAQCTLHTAYCTLHTAHCTGHTAHCKLHSSKFKVHNKHCMLETEHCTLYKHIYLLLQIGKDLCLEDCGWSWWPVLCELLTWKTNMKPNPNRV